MYYFIEIRVDQSVSSHSLYYIIVITSFNQEITGVINYYMRIYVRKNHAHVFRCFLLNQCEAHTHTRELVIAQFRWWGDCSD